MAGLPLTSGFIAKFGVFSEAWANGFAWLVIVALLASVVAFGFYLRVIVAMYMDETEAEEVVVSTVARWVLAIAVVGTVLMGIFPAPLIDFAANAFPL
jgi:NADH-quinone oxidoreductase subunit N